MDQDQKNQIDNMINQFKNGENRFNESPLFQATVRSLAGGVAPIEIIDRLLQYNDELNRSQQHYLSQLATLSDNKNNQNQQK